MPTSRSQLLNTLRTAAADALEVAERVTRRTIGEATHAESKAENKYDTRSLEASYLARGQAERVGQLRHVHSFLASLDDTTPHDAIGVGTFAQLEDEDGHIRWLLVAPVGGGLEAEVDGTTVSLVTPKAPLGRSLLGLEADDDVELEHGPRSGQVWTILRIC